MRLTFKILKLFAAAIITLSIILFTASLFVEDKVADIVFKTLNKNISTKLDISSFKLSFLRKFPKASLELKDVLVHSSKNFNSKEFTGINTDTLLATRSMSVEFKITDILKGIYTIERIGVRNGEMNLYTDKAGLVNYDISVSKEVAGGEDFSLNLEIIYLNDIKANYINLATKLKIEGLINKGRLKSRISGSSIDFTGLADLEISGFQLYNTTISRTVIASIDLTLNSSKSGILFKKGSLRIDNYEFVVTGGISSDDRLDLDISGNKVDISKIRIYLPAKYNTLLSDYDPSGILIVKSKITGLLSRTTNPHIEINWLLSNGHVKYGKSDLAFNNISLSGYFSNGSGNRPGTSIISIKDLKAMLGTSEYTGSFTVSGFDKPITSLILKGRVFPAELKEFFNLKNISATNGSVDLDLKLVTDFWPKKKIELNNIIDLKPEATLVFNSLTIGFNSDKQLFKNLNGNLALSKIIKAENFEFTYKGQRIKIAGEFKNLPEWIAGRHVQMMASADVTFDRFIPDAFVKDSLSSEITTLNKSSFSLPDDIFLDINFNIDSLDYKTFSASKIFGTLNYRPKLLTFKSFNMESLKGMISGEGFIVQNNLKAYIARGNFDIREIDVKDAFTSFHNFGQDFLKAENIAGTLSGTLSILLPLDSMMNPQTKTINAEGKYQLHKGSLINFEPVEQLSKYIELSELQNINFETLENDFFIRNNYLYIPQMDIRSSAVDLDVNGKHSFDNNYEYHVKVLLSEILSKKRKKNKTSNNEFGVVEDDGLGRTKLLLKIENKGNEVKVGYDLKAAENGVKNNIKSEKQKLKSILNQEYGWYKNDSIPEQKPEEKKPRFRISWDETDTIKTTIDTLPVKKKGVLKNLIRKN